MYLPNPDPVLKAQGKDIKIYSELLSDGHLGGCVSSRKAGVKSLEWGIDRGKAKSRQARLIEDLFKSLPINNIIDTILDAVFFGYQPIEVMWKKIGNYILPKDVVGKPPEWFIFSPDNNLRFRSKENYFEGEELPDKKFLIPRHCATYQNPYGFPELSRCFWPVTFKRGGMKFWVIFTEKYGMPYIVGKKPRGTLKEETDNFADMLGNMVQDAVAVIPDDSSVEIIEASGKGASAEIYERFA
jgi:phage gp29-like protein